MGLITAENIPPTIKKMSRPTNIQLMPLMRRRRFRICPPGETDIGPPEKPRGDEFAELLPGRVPGGAFWNRTVSVYSAGPSPNRKPQLRQKRNSLGIGSRQFPQIVVTGSISGSIDISLKDSSSEPISGASAGKE
jgi:hypothetical protein